MSTFKVIDSVEEAIKLCDARLLWIVHSGSDYAEPAAPDWSRWWASGQQLQHVHDGLFAVLLEE